jgi:hypothetical protein
MLPFYLYGSPSLQKLPDNCSESQEEETQEHHPKSLRTFPFCFSVFVVGLFILHSVWARVDVHITRNEVIQQFEDELFFDSAVRFDQMGNALSA